MNELLESFRERLSNLSITALYPAMRTLIDTAWDPEAGFADEECAELYEQSMRIAEVFANAGDETGIPHYVLYLGTMVRASMATDADQAYIDECVALMDRYIHESVELGLNIACFDLGNALFEGNRIWEMDREEGLALMKQALELPARTELGVDPDALAALLREGYETCAAAVAGVAPTAPGETPAPTEPVAAPASGNAGVATAEAKRPKPRRIKIFPFGYYLAGIAAVLGYLLVSILLRMEFGWQSAYDAVFTNGWLVGIGVMVLSNYSVLPILLMAYFYKRNNEKHSIPLVVLYVLFLVACYFDSFWPYIDAGTLGEGDNLLYAFLLPTVFLVLHRALSVLIYFFMRGKEGSSDHRIYYGLVLLAPVMAIIFLIAIGYWIFQAASGEGGSGSYSGSSGGVVAVDMKAYVRGELNGGRNAGVYYDDGWKVVDYWNNGASLNVVQGEDFRNTYLQDSNGKRYILPTNCPDKEKIYYFD